MLMEALLISLEYLSKKMWCCHCWVSCVLEKIRKSTQSTQSGKPGMCCMCFFPIYPIS